MDKWINSSSSSSGSGSSSNTEKRTKQSETLEQRRHDRLDVLDHGLATIRLHIHTTLDGGNIVLAEESALEVIVDVCQFHRTGLW